MSGTQTDTWYDHQTLLRDVNHLLAVYDQSAQGVLNLAYTEGYFEGIDPDLLKWPPSQTPDGPIGVEGLGYRIRLINAIFQGVPKLRDSRLTEAHEVFLRSTPAYRDGTRIYAQVKHQFLERKAGTGQDFLKLYQAVYVEALRAENLFTPDEGEAALERARLSRVPLSHAQPVAEKLKATVAEDDPQWAEVYRYTLRGEATQASLREVFLDIARRTLDYLAVGELIAVRYNIYNNFAWFGSAIWIVLSNAELLAESLRRLTPPGVVHHQLDGLKDDILLGQSMMVEFFQAHQQDPTHLKPTGYWYGHHYTYLTRDMIDLTFKIIDNSNRLIGQLTSSGERRETAVEQDSEETTSIEKIQLPDLLAGTATGQFLEYPHVGRQAHYSNTQRVIKLARWAYASWKMIRHKYTIEETVFTDSERLDAAWDNNLQWAEKTLRIFGIDVRVTIDPEFADIARELDLAGGKQKILFFPTHQSVFDHPVMYHVLQSPEFLEAMGWEAPRPCTILSRSGLISYVTLRIGSWSPTLFGVSETEFDRLLEDVDGYVVLPRSGDTGNATQRFSDFLDYRPGIIYASGTVGAFDIQSIPHQHGLFSKIPSDVVIIPMAFRGIHSIWPKSPRRNIRINPGLVEVAIAPPMLGETTLFPKRRSLRPQLEPAALFQAVQIVNLLNPNARSRE